MKVLVTAPCLSLTMRMFEFRLALNLSTCERKCIFARQVKDPSMLAFVCRWRYSYSRVLFLLLALLVDLGVLELKQPTEADAKAETNSQMTDIDVDTCTGDEVDHMRKEMDFCPPSERSFYVSFRMPLEIIIFVCFVSSFSSSCRPRRLGAEAANRSRSQRRD